MCSLVLCWPLLRQPRWRSVALRWPLCGGKGGAKGAPLAAMRRQRLRNGRSAGRYARNGGAKGAPLATMRAKVALRTLS
ncbi:uncharacterized protein LOC117574247 isoform X3 [Drosophila albomicans]|uniref:Uncharacterized protein LOC117574247 isoform X2 n=1 Tax=Drosophila albomicans TaxID=7291 RepID=A0A9C6WK91_DROAB|nr:uncharacterized protein LOC117574247 isoform X2 [Drosophila albomicans]XP_051862543.1 uncharacterized protein LOC117574247 isoform X3 [Drosophila albomicans]